MNIGESGLGKDKVRANLFLGEMWAYFKELQKGQSKRKKYRGSEMGRNGRIWLT